MDTANRTRSPMFLIALLTVIAGAGLVDLAFDQPEDWFNAHVLFEGASLLLCLGSAAYLWVGWYKEHRSLCRLQRTLGERSAERDAWRARAQKLLKGLGEAIDSQLLEWDLTCAERETAMLLLKGYSHKDVAELTGRSERTARQHSVAVYRKSGLSGRAELSAFFLEDLLLPSPSEPAHEMTDPDRQPFPSQ